MPDIEAINQQAQDLAEQCDQQEANMLRYGFPGTNPLGVIVDLLVGEVCEDDPLRIAQFNLKIVQKRKAILDEVQRQMQEQGLPVTTGLVVPTKPRLIT